jgi:hypothetical protein
MSVENEFKLDCSGKKLMIKDVYLLVNLKNNYAGGTTTLPCVEQCFDYFSVSVNGESTELDHVDSIDWFMRNYLNQNNEELARYGAQTGFSTAFAHSRTKTKVLGMEGLDDCHLNVNTNTTPAGNTYQLDILGHQYAYLLIENDGKGGPASGRLQKS